MEWSDVMITGGCYCGEVRYEATGDFLAKGMCFCRECRHISGGGANVLLGMPAAGFIYTKGQPGQFKRSDFEDSVTREFCQICGTHLVTRSPRMESAVLVKVGSLDDQDVYDMPSMAVYCSEKKPYHVVPDGVRCFDKFPTR